MKKRTLFALPLTMGLLLLPLGCDGGPLNPGGPGAIPGLYVLQSIGGNALPFVITEGPTYSLEVTAELLQVNGDGTCSFVSDKVVRSNGVVDTFTVDISCTWTASGSTFTFELPDYGGGGFFGGNADTTGSVVGDTLTIFTNYEPWVYVRS